MNTSFRPRKFVFLSAIIACPRNDMRSRSLHEISIHRARRIARVPFDSNFQYVFDSFFTDRVGGERSFDWRKINCRNILFLRGTRGIESFRSVLAETCFLSFLLFRMPRACAATKTNRFSDLANFLSSLSFCASFLLDIARSCNWKSTRARACAFTEKLYSRPVRPESKGSIVISLSFLPSTLLLLYYSFRNDHTRCARVRERERERSNPVGGLGATVYNRDKREIVPLLCFPREPS